MRDYRKINSNSCQTIESVMDRLRQYDYPVFTEFNGHKIYSDDTLEAAYLRVTGYTKLGLICIDKERRERNIQRKKQHEAEIPRLTKEWNERGREALDEAFYSEWENIVSSQLENLYQGAELGYVLEIVRELNSGLPFQSVKDTLDKQGHSGASFVTVVQIVSRVCNRGTDFKTFIQYQLK